MDPWKHRSEGMRCKTCMWFVPKAGRPPVHIVGGSKPLPDEPIRPGRIEHCSEPPAINLGRCRRHSPTMNGYPVVFVNDWCGDHKLNENAV